jgi:hypothetical protein
MRRHVSLLKREIETRLKSYVKSTRTLVLQTRLDVIQVTLSHKAYVENVWYERI